MLFSSEKEEETALALSPEGGQPTAAPTPTTSILLNGPSGTTPPPSTTLASITENPPASSSASSPFISGISSPSQASAPPPPLSQTGRRASTPKISFAPLPSVPPEYKLQRRNSITLGVASRKNLLTGQGGPGLDAGGPPGVGGARQGGKLYMSDADWEIYKRQYESKGADPVDLGQLAKSGAKALWGKVKRARSSSQSSQASTSSLSSSIEPQSPSPSSANIGLPPTHTPTVPPSPGGLGTVTEEELDSQASMKESHVRSGGLPMIPGSPPPRPRSLSTNSDTSTSTSNFTSTSEDESNASASGSGSGSGSASPSSPTHETYMPWNHEHSLRNSSRGVAVVPASASFSGHHNHHNHLNYHGHEDGDGDATPRRRPSPPPPTQPNIQLEGEEGPSTHHIANGASLQLEHEQRRAQAHDWETGRDHQYGNERNKRTAVLGFDQERFGHVLTLDQSQAREQREI